MEIKILSHYSLIHDLAQNETSFLPHFYNKNPSYGLPNQTKQKSRKRQSLFFFSISFFLSLLTINMVCEANNNNNGNTYLVEIQAWFTLVLLNLTLLIAQ